MPDLAIRIPPQVPGADWLRALAPAARLILHADAAARAAAAPAWGAAFTEQACRAVTEGSRTTLWLGPDEYLLLDCTPTADAAVIADALEHALRDIAHALVDVSHRQFALEVSGRHAATILSGACPLDLDLAEFPVGMCTRTVLAKADIVLWRIRDDAFHLEVWRSFAGYATGLLREIAAEFYPGVSARARAVMVCGTTSGAGKSFLATALARWYSRQGLKVAPFKAQNMSNNARVVAGGEMGSAQYFQALAARCVPDVRMNPILLKPEADTHSQVILLGQRRDDLSRVHWHERAERLWPTVRASLEYLLASNDVVVIEGAGSPAEINLASTDIVNMRVAEAADAATLIVCDIDRGGAFAHLFGTHRLLNPEHRNLVRGFVLNKFRGDVDLLAPGPQMLQDLTGVATLAVLPLWRDHGLPEEDGVFDARPAAGTGLAVAILAYPYISNLDEFASLNKVPGLSLCWAREPRSIAAADLLILPGSKHVAADLAWLRQRGLDAAIAAHVSADKPTLAICGGLQMLGGELTDPYGVEGGAQGLGLLPFATEFQRLKRCAHGRHTLGRLGGFWAPLSGTAFDAYEIRHGMTVPADAPGPEFPRPLRPVLADNCGWQYGQTLALYLHGMLESPEVMRTLFGQQTPTLDDTLTGLADFIEAHFAPRALMSLLDDKQAINEPRPAPRTP